MSSVLSKEDILFVQRMLKCSGLYTGRLDSQWGPITDAAVDKFNVGSEKLARSFGRFDPRSEGNIYHLHLKAQRAARVFLRSLIEAGIDARILSGTRTYAQQNALFRQGRYGNAGQRVTRARGGQSNHNFGIAWDIGLFDGGKYLTTVAPYDKAAEIASIDGVFWGGNWRGFKDRPHYQLETGFGVTELRNKFEAGIAFV